MKYHNHAVEIIKNMSAGYVVIQFKNLTQKIVLRSELRPA